MKRILILLLSLLLLAASALPCAAAPAGFVTMDKLPAPRYLPYPMFVRAE